MNVVMVFVSRQQKIRLTALMIVIARAVIVVMAFVKQIAGFKSGSLITPLKKVLIGKKLAERRLIAGFGYQS